MSGISLKAKASVSDEDQCHELLDVLPQAVWTSTPEGFLDYVNHYAEEYTGVPTEQLLGWAWLDFLHPDDQERARSAWMRAIQTGDEYDIDYRVRDRNGHYRWAKTHGIPIRNEHGQIIKWVGLMVDIEDRKRMEESLRAGEEFNRQIVESSLDCIKTLDLQGRLLSMNLAGQRMLGVSDITPYIGRPMTDLWRPQDRPQVAEAIAQARAGNEGSFQGLLITPSGQTRGLDVRITPIRNANGEPERLLAISRDITEQKYAEETLRQEEERFRLVADAARVLVFDVGINLDKPDPVFHFPEIKVNAVHGLPELLGYSPQEVPLTLEWMISIIHPDDVADFIRQSQEGFKVLKDLTLHYRLRHKDGHYVNVEETSRIVWDDTGRPVRLVGGIRDMTERMTMEAELRESEEKFRSLAEISNTPIGIIQGRKFVYANPYLINLSGYTPEELYAMDILQLVHPDFRAMIADRYHRRLMGDPTLPARYEYKMITKSGQERWIDITPIRIDLKGVPSIIGNALDVTERKQTEEALKLAKEELEERVRERTEELSRSNADLERFAYIASHDHQEPLRMIASFAGLLETKYKDNIDPEANEYIEFVVSGAKHLSNMIKDMLEYSRINTRTRPPELADSETILTQALRNLRLTIEETQAEITHDPLPQVLADRTQLTQVFQNLVGNAIKFRKDGVTPKIHVSAKVTDGKCLFSVKDNGIGIDPQYNNRIFVAFQRLHARRDKYPGTGIGLAVVKRIIERHGGQVCMESKPGEGSTFYFTLQLPHNTSWTNS